jgi:hypothetical protein
MELTDLKESIPGLADKSHNDRIRIFGWYLHVHKNQPTFTAAEIGKCYRELHFSEPSSFGAYFKNLADRKELLRTGRAYKIESKVREKLNAAFGVTEVTVKVNDLLAGLANTIPDMAERTYYKEALICYRYGSRRAAVIMTWNIAYSHLCDYVFKKRLNDFNARWVLSMPGMHKSKNRTIATLEDFSDELKESEVLTVCRDGGLITKNIYNIMHAALGRRNAAAHPNAVVIDKLQTDAFIVDLITNVIHQIA